MPVPVPAEEPQDEEEAEIYAEHCPQPPEEDRVPLQRCLSLRLAIATSGPDEAIAGVTLDRTVGIAKGKRE